MRELLTDPALEGVCAAPFDAARHLPLPPISSPDSDASSTRTTSTSTGARATKEKGKGGGGKSGEVALERELQAAFRNVTAVMDCVGCEKCRVWGKLQLMGVATALKVLVAERKASEAIQAAAAAHAAAKKNKAAEGGGSRPRSAAASPLPPPPPLVLERNEVVALVNLFERLSRSMNTVREMQARLDAGEVPAWPPGVDRARAREAGGGGGGGRGGVGGDALAGALGVF